MIGYLIFLAGVSFLLIGLFSLIWAFTLIVGGKVKKQKKVKYKPLKLESWRLQ